MLDFYASINSTQIPPCTESIHNCNPYCFPMSPVPSYDTYQSTGPLSRDDDTSVQLSGGASSLWSRGSQLQNTWMFFIIGSYLPHYRLCSIIPSQKLLVPNICRPTDKESAHPPGNGFSRALESRFLVPKNEAQCA